MFSIETDNEYTILSDIDNNIEWKIKDNDVIVIVNFENRTIAFYDKETGEETCYHKVNE